LTGTEPVFIERESRASEVDFGSAVPPVLQRVYAARGVTDAGDLDRSLSRLLPPAGLADAGKAARRIVRAIAAQESILIVGDFDADGATSVALGVSLLRQFGAADVQFLVPNRFEFGYGLSPEIVDLAATFDPALLITVDNGVSSVTGVAAANARGMDVIITDHHLAGLELPDAYAIVNPNVVGSEFPSKNLAGVGVIYYLLGLVRAELRREGWFENRSEPNLADWLDLVALGTVADVVPLDRNNRILVHQGLLRMRAGRCRSGIRALVEVAGRDLSRLTAQDLGYAVGPRLNAAGRLDDMSVGIRCLMAEDLAAARGQATALDELNRARRELELEMVRDAELLVSQQDLDVRNQFGVCVYEPGWHQGIVGIVAGRLREKIDRPVIAFADAGDTAPDELKGSARSLPALHIRDTLDAIAARHPGMLKKFGGHAMAAGLSLKRVHYERFARAFDAEVRRQLPDHAFQRTIETDGSLSETELSLDMARLLADAGPWGQGFPEPLFYDEFQLVSQRVVGEHHLKLVVKQGQRVLDAIAFRQRPVQGASRVRLAYRLSENTWNDRTTLQLVVEHLTALA
jgi:single-stranded-DNA-specific exonuclease